MPKPHAGPYGVAKIDKAERTAYGVAFQGDTILEVVKRQLSQPLASANLIAQQLGLSPTTVRGCLATPYARRQLDGKDKDISMLVNELHEGQGDTVVYWRKSIIKGTNELDKEDPNPAILTNARETGRDISRSTGLHRQSLTIEQRVTGEQDYGQLDELEVDPDVAQFLVIDEGEGESPITPPQEEGGIIPVDQNTSRIDLTDDQAGLPEGSELAQQDDQGESESAEPTSR